MDRPEHHAQSIASEPDATRSTRGAWRIVVVLLLLAAVLGVVVFRNLVTSERYLAQVWHQMGDRGTALSVEGCVDEVLGWSDRCEAIKGLCDLAVTGMMVRCLEGQDRRDYCFSEAPRMQTTHFGVPECEARHLESRHDQAVCAATYRAVDGHCRLIIRDEAL
jgi:hypothetical protein